MKKYHILYKTLNLRNDKIYYGVHSTDELNDGYIGSGTAIKNAILKYGKQSFKFEILEFFDSRKEALLAERQIVTESVVNDRNTYNLAIGGGGGGFINKSHTPEFKQLISSIHKGKIVSEATRQKMREHALRDDNPSRGVPRTSEVKSKISNSVSGKKHRKFNPNPVIRYDDKTEKLYDSMYDAAIDIGVASSSNISKAIKNGRKAYGYYWKLSIER